MDISYSQEKHVFCPNTPLDGLLGGLRGKNIDFPKIVETHYKNTCKAIFSQNLRFFDRKKYKTSIWLSKMTLIALIQIRIFAVNCHFRTHYMEISRDKNIDFLKIFRNPSKTGSKHIFSRNFRF